MSAPGASNDAWVEQQSEQRAGSNASQVKQSSTRPSNDIASFMARVVPWPQDGEPGVINLHLTSPKGPGMRGRAFIKVEDLLSMAQSGATKPGVMKDIYYCLSSQRESGRISNNGYATAIRNQRNVVALKALWIDVDVKPDKGYATVKEAVAGIEEFIKRANLPPASAVVLSGGGVHVYWISNKPLSKYEWQPYADGLAVLAKTHGLLCDLPVTIDSARILRVPGTFNYKSNPPKPVKLAALGQDYEFAAALVHLPAPRPPEPAVTATVTKRIGVDWDAKFPKRPPLPLGTESLSDGIYVDNDAPLDYAEVFAGCPHFAEAFHTHGANYPQGLWMLDVLASTFLEDGDHIAHTLSKGYAKYSVEETDKMVERKKRERKQRGLGWPSCKAFENAGCKLCASCKHYGKIKSPLNLAGPQQPPPLPPSFVDPYAEFAGPAFPSDVLPPTLAKFVDVEYRAMGADPSAIAMGALTAVAGAIHAETSVRAGEGWWERPILWTALVGQPSTMKSPIIDKVKKPLSAIDNERSKRWRQEYAIWQQNKK
jgi:hypothetical protein